MPSGYVPTFYEELRDFGVELDLNIFGDTSNQTQLGHASNG
jgi:hypothetical protein